MKIFSTFGCVLILFVGCEGALDGKTKRMIDEANKKGGYLGLVIPNMFEMNPLLNHPSFKSSNYVIDYAGRRFRFGKIYKKRVIIVMSGMGMVNSAVATQLLLSLFEIEGVVHYGIAGNANPNLNIGDVTIAHYWSHSALWNWQRYGQGADDLLPFEGEDGFTREIGYLKFAAYSANGKEDNFLNNVWYEPEEVYPVNGTPEETQHVFWIAVDSKYFTLSKNLQKLKLEDCINATTCLSKAPVVTTVERGTSANIYLDNAAYRGFLYTKFNISPVEMESAAVALICSQQNVPFITFRALSDLAGGGSAPSNEADTFSSLAAHNSVLVVLEFIKLLSMYKRKLLHTLW